MFFFPVNVLLSCLSVNFYKDPAASSLQGRIALNMNEGYMHDR